MRTAPRRGTVFAVVVALLLTAVHAGGVALAGQRFSDVGSSHPFSEEIDAMATAGITTGYTDGTFRPGQPLTRQAMAAFLVRGLGRVAHDEHAAELPATNDGVQLGEVTMRAGAASGGGGWVVLTGMVQALVPDSRCPCSIQARLYADGEDVLSLAGMEHLADAGGNLRFGQVHVHVVLPIEADTETTYTLRGFFGEWGPDGQDPLALGRLQALYVPFDGAGNQPA